MTIVARQFHLKARPEGLPVLDNFERLRTAGRFSSAIGGFPSTPTCAEG